MPGGKTIEQPTSTKLPEIEVVSPQGIKNLGRSFYGQVGHCIYCGSKDRLSTEHIIPFGLCGTSAPGDNNPVLPGASCNKCSDITGKVENTILRGELRQVRVLMKLMSRSKHSHAPKMERLRILRNGVAEEIELPLEEYPILFTFPIMAIPRFLRGTEGTGIDLVGVHTVNFGKPVESLKSRFAGQTIELKTETVHPVAFARMIAKTAYAVAYAEGKLERIEGASPILPSILGEVDDIGSWVGTLTDPIRRYPEILHRIAVREDSGRGLLIADVQLFANSDSPCYGVILGPLRHPKAASLPKIT